mmetsp:Transcript_29811/g.46743  ORF Transcript_29811/g.46743 Transcript_29811/m.46743 type:complete len:281 (+) Transcript_29811:231-1073(+)
MHHDPGLNNIMGRKRKQGKARKATKAKQEAEERDNHTNDERRQPPAAQIQQWQSGIPKCTHGVDDSITSEAEGISISSQFARAFHKSFQEAVIGDLTLSNCLLAANSAAMDKFPEVRNDSAKMGSVISYFLWSGTEHFLEDNYGSAKVAATIARFIEQFIAVELKLTQAELNWPKIEEMLIRSDVHTLVKFFRHRIPCSCLDEKYEEVKNTAKMGICYNEHCNLPNRTTERSKTMYCSRCRCATYCSRECQKTAWKVHKSNCDKVAKIQAQFDARQQNTT